MVNLILAIPQVETGWFLARWFVELFQGVAGWGVGYAFAIVIATIFIRLIMLPLDVWQKYGQKQMTEGQAKMQPDLVKAQKACKGDKNLYQQKQLEIYKKHNVNIVGNCLSMIVNMGLSMVIMFTMFSSMMKVSTNKIELQFYELNMVYEQSIMAQKGIDTQGLTKEDIWDIVTNATEAEKTIASNASLDAYPDVEERFLWIKNLWRKDNYEKPIPNFAEAKMGDSSILVFLDEFGIGDADDKVSDAERALLEARYNTVMSSLINSNYNKGWNGYFIIAILSGATTWLAVAVSSGKLFKKNKKELFKTEKTEEEKMKEMQGKVIGLIMPIGIGLITLMYSSISGLYIVTSQLIATALGFGTTPLVAWMVKKKGERGPRKPRDPNKTIFGQSKAVEKKDNLNLNDYSRKE